MQAQHSETNLSTREKILQMAAILFWEKGYTRVSVEEIIRSVGIAKGTFYHHFPSKDALLDTIVERMTDEIITKLEETLNNNTMTPREKVDILFSEALQWKLDNIPLMLTILESWLNEANIPFMKKIEELAYKKSLPFYTRLIREGQEAGHFNIGKMQPEDVAKFIITLGLALMNETAEYLLHLKENPEYEEKFITLYKSYQYAYERMLGLPEYSVDYRARDFILAVKNYMEKGIENGNSGAWQH